MRGKNFGRLVRFLQCALCCFKMECLIVKGNTAQFGIFGYVSAPSVPRRPPCELRLGFSTLTSFDHGITERTGMTCFFERGSRILRAL